jgi:hypothetical protein
MLIFVSDEDQNYMTAKETFINRLLSDVKRLQSLIELSKDLPDSYFDNMVTPTPFNNPSPTIDDNNKLSLSPPLPDKSEIYGWKKKAVVKLFMANKMAMTKGEVVKQFKAKYPEEPVPLEVVTNALHNLKTAKVLMNVALTEPDYKGSYWVLRKWVNEEDELMSEFYPQPVDALARYIEE